MQLLRFAILLPLLVCVGCEEPPRQADESQATVASGPGDITAEELHEHIHALASDEFLGRPPSGAGADKTVHYIAEQFEKAGLQPANGDSWFQEVPLVSLTVQPNAVLDLKGPEQSMSLYHGENTVLWTRRISDGIALKDSELVFVGYGIVAPEFNWNDYEGVDVRGKTVVMLVNDPGYATGDPELFNGRAMTYYGRWTYKFEEAARQGAAGAVVIHDEGPAGYPWEVVSNSWTGPQFHLPSGDGGTEPVKVESWITRDVADRLFQQSGFGYQEAVERALKREFRAVPLGVTASTVLKNTIERTTSRNVVGVLPGSERPEESVLYMAHWDHLGTRPDAEGDAIYNGAVDNATGVAALIEIAERFGAGPQPERSVVFLAVTAEEQGLLGSKYYAENPLLPLEKTAGAINMDGMRSFGETRDVIVIGHGSSEMEDLLARFAEEQSRRVAPEPTPEKGYYFRSDHFNFAKRGVPSLYAKAGTDYVEGGTERGERLLKEYDDNRYHKPSDEYDPSWDLGGLAQDARLFHRVGQGLAFSALWPEWREGNAFRAVREKSKDERGK